MLETLLAVFFPHFCPYCRRLIGIRQTECDECRSGFAKSAYHRNLPTGEMCVAPFVYECGVRDAILDLKFKSMRFNAKSIGKYMFSAVRECYGEETFTYITAVPMRKKVIRERGYNQAELLSKELSNLMEVPYEKLLAKCLDRPPQHSLDKEDRKKNVEGLFAPLQEEKLQGSTVLLVDDICTTGYTLGECCRLLKKSGAEKVLCVTASISGNFA